jgi:hypothetical protein
MASRISQLLKAVPNGFKMTKDEGLRELLGNVTEFVEAPSLGFRVEVEQCDGDKSQNGV